MDIPRVSTIPCPAYEALLPQGEQRESPRPVDVEPELSGSPNIDGLARKVGHAINNPLGALMLNLELALEALGDGTREATEARMVETRTFIDEAMQAAQQAFDSVEVELKAMAAPLIEQQGARAPAAIRGS